MGDEVWGSLLLAVRWFVALALQPHCAVAFGRVWWPTAAMLAVALAGGISSGTPEGVLAPPMSWWGSLGAEIVLGAVVGVLASLPAFALIGAASASAVGLQMTARPVVRLCVSGAVVAALVLDLHHPALVVLRDQAIAFPAGRVTAWLPRLAELPSLLAIHLDGALMLGLTLATPVLLTMVVMRSVATLVASGPAGVRPVGEVFGVGLATVCALLAFVASWAVYPQGWARAAVATMDEVSAGAEPSP